MRSDVRWKQRFSNYEKAVGDLSEAMECDRRDKLSQAGLVQMFEVAFELAWKTLKDKLEYEGSSVNSPRETIKTAFQNGFIDKGDLWLEALDNRNLLAHTYDEQKSKDACILIRTRYYLLLKALCDALSKEAGG